VTARYWLGIDIGGTFTDVVLVGEESGRIATLKVLTTPRDVAEGFLEAVDCALAAVEVQPTAVRHIVHGTTVATNAIIEKRTASTALVVTRGFRDLLEIARQTRPDLYDLFCDKPAPLVPRDLCFEVTERLDADGTPLIPLEESEIEQIAAAVRSREVESIAICFLHSYRHPEHERRAAALLADWCPGVSVSASCDILPEFREYSRASTTVVNAAIRPIVGGYLDRIVAGLTRRGVGSSLFVMQSNGGVCSAKVARERPAYIVESGPAAGVTAAVHIGRQAGFSNIISFDMGGTTAKASLIQDGRPSFSTEFEVGASAATGRGRTRGHGYPVHTPVLDLVEVGAGGGSIAWVDREGIMHVGPQSAGADPGPACYGRGGREATVTDANVVLGRLAPDHFLGGRMMLDADAAWRAVEACARATNLDVIAAANGIVEIANASMVGAVRLVSIQRGYDPREFTLLAFGGAGPLHANALAEALAIPATLVPPEPGVASALGLLLADLAHDFMLTYVAPLERVDPNELTRIYEDFEREGTEVIAAAALASRVRFARAMDLRYVGQSYELRVPVTDGTLDLEHLRRIAGQFHAEHERSYGFSARTEPVELVNIRLTAVGEVTKPGGKRTQAAPKPAVALYGTRSVFFSETGFVEARVYDRSHLGAGHQIVGPAIVEQSDSTTLIHPGFGGWFDLSENLLVRRLPDIDVLHHHVARAHER
jgi:N-methylhydantoinase A